jgi:protein-disulfide isomerase
VRGPAAAPVVIEYADFECHFCRREHHRLASLEVRLVFRHFPVKSKHPRAWPTACAAEAAALQGAFWEMHDALFADKGRLDDPHLWARAERLGLDVDRFDADRRSDAVRERVERDFKAGLRGGVMATPTFVVDGELRRDLDPRPLS